jgi:hypothetical protein
LVAASVELLAIFTFPMLAYFGPRLLQESNVEQARVRVSPFKKTTWKKETLKKKETVSVINRMCILLSPKQQSALSIN